MPVPQFCGPFGAHKSHNINFVKALKQGMYRSLVLLCFASFLSRVGLPPRVRSSGSVRSSAGRPATFGCGGMASVRSLPSVVGSMVRRSDFGRGWEWVD